MTRKEAYALREKIERAAELQDDETAIDSIELYPKWNDHMEAIRDKRYQYNGLLYRCIQTHNTQAGWTPDITPALYVLVSLEEWPAWIQPMGSEDAYEKGAHVSHNEKHWESEYDNNVWEPGVYGWVEK